MGDARPPTDVSELDALRAENRRLRADLATLGAAHRSAAELLAAYTRAVPDVSLILDEDGRYLEVLGDPALLARPSSEVLRRTVSDIFPGPIAGAFLAVIRAAVETGRPQSTEYELTVPSGQRWFESRVVRLETPRDGKWCVLWLSWDITARKVADARLQLQTELLTTVFDHIPLFIDLFDGEGRFLLINRAWEEVLGYSLEDCRRENVLFRLVPEPDEQARVVDVMSSKTPGWHPFRLTTRSGRVIDTLWTNVALSDGRSIGIGQDVTERKLIEARSWQAQKLESIGRLAGGVAHDFNNVLTAILGYAEVLQGQLPPSAAAADLGEIVRAAERARELTRQLLAFARRQVIAPRIVELGALATGMERLLHRLLGEAIELELRLAAEPWPVLADAAQLEQVILNLAINARDAMPTGGRLVIETENVEQPPASTELVGPCVRLSVSDSGEGIPPELLDHVFEPFFTTKRPGEGTGLGLATVHGIVAQSGGRVTVTSAAGHGARFDIYLPRAAAPAAVAPTPEPAPAS
ncbi:PAS domain-containing protein, partial [Myxococcota bacterium]|nr:PAS domain-containing protein [Myxococcota bacterium]